MGGGEIFDNSVDHVVRKRVLGGEVLGVESGPIALERERERENGQ